MDILPIDFAATWDFITTNPTTGAVSDADSTPTVAIFEDTTDTAMQTPTATKRTGLTGNYRTSNTLSAANGYEVSKCYNVVASATVNSVAGKAVIARFRCAPAEAQAGVPKVDVQYIKGTTSAGAAGYMGLDWGNINAPTTVVALSGTTIQNSSQITTGTAQGGGNNTITLATGASAVDGTYDPALIRIRSGTGAGQIRLILDYNGTSKVAVVDRQWRTNPDATSVYDVLAATNLQSTNEGLAQGGAAGSLTLNASASSVNDTYKGQLIVLRGGTGQDQSAICTAYNGTTKVATVSPNWVTTPDSTTVYMMWPIGPSSVTVNNDKTGYTAATVSDKTGYSLAAGSISDATYAADATPKAIETGTAQAGSSTTITLKSAANANNNFYNNTIVKLTGGTGVGQSRFISAYVGSTKVATVAAWVTAPDNTTTYDILPFDAVAGASAPTAAQVATAVWQDTTGSDFTTAGSIGKSLFTSGNAPGAASGLALVGSNMGTTTSLTGDAYARLGAPAGASVSADIAAVKSDTGNLVTRITSTLFSGITSLAQWLGAIAGKQTPNSTAQTEIRATGAGSGTFDATTDSQEAVRDQLTAGVTATTVSDKTGYALTSAYDPAKTAAQSGDIMKVSSGTGANQISLSSGQVTVGTNSDKTGYTLTSAGIQAIWDYATSLLVTSGSIGKFLIDRLTGNVPQTGDAYSLLTSAQSEPTSVPAANASPIVKLGYVFTKMRNKRITTSSSDVVRNDADSAAIATSTISDDGTSFTKTKDA